MPARPIGDYLKGLLDRKPLQMTLRALQSESGISLKLLAEKCQGSATPGGKGVAGKNAIERAVCDDKIIFYNTGVNTINKELSKTMIEKLAEVLLANYPEAVGTAFKKHYKDILHQALKTPAEAAISGKKNYRGDMAGIPQSKSPRWSARTATAPSRNAKER